MGKRKILARTPTRTKHNFLDAKNFLQLWESWTPFTSRAPEAIILAHSWITKPESPIPFLDERCQKTHIQLYASLHFCPAVTQSFLLSHFMFVNSLFSKLPLQYNHSLLCIDLIQLSETFYRPPISLQLLHHSKLPLCPVIFTNDCLNMPYSSNSSFLL